MAKIWMFLKKQNTILQADFSHKETYTVSITAKGFVIILSNITKTETHNKSLCFSSDNTYNVFK